MLVLVDTGPVVAYLDRGDPAHQFVRSRWERLSGRFITTGAVLTECMHFLRSLPDGPQRLLDFFRDGLLLQDAFAMESLDRAASLMERYAGVPMDFADATLVVLAEKVQAPRIVTLDERGFRTFRYGRNKPFQLILQDTG